VLGALGWSVWWDRQLVPGIDYHRAIADQIEAAQCIIVLWSRHSIDSEMVVDEADAARVRKVLLPVLVEDVTPPFGFGQFQHVNLATWQGDINDPQFRALQEAMERIASRSASPQVRDVSQPALPRAPVRPSADHVSSVFVCYRREDTQDAAGRLQDRLIERYGSGRVFMDIDSVPLGVDFVDHVSQQIAGCSAVLVMIGKQWLTIKDRKRRRRLDDADDLVRAEIRAALQQNVPVIPVVVQNADMPTTDDLPGDIRPLSRRNGIHLRPEQWRDGVERLLKELDKVMKA
jgi:TIR domain